MENSAVQAQDKGYMGFLPRTPAMHSRNQSFLKDNSLDAPANQPLLTSQVLAIETVEEESARPGSAHAQTKADVTSRKASTDGIVVPPQESEAVVKLAMTTREITVE